MKRRTFCGSALVAVAAVTSSRSVLAAVAEALGPITEDVPAVGGDGGAVALSARDVEDFRRSLRERLLTRTDEGYERARQAVERRVRPPSRADARCTGAADVVRAVDFARTHRLLVAVRGGGHNISGQSSATAG